MFGVVGRRAFHIFDKTHMTWVCSSKALGYQRNAPDMQLDPETGEEEDSDSAERFIEDDVENEMMFDT
jgi:hypothetical protein